MHNDPGSRFCENCGQAMPVQGQNVAASGASPMIIRIGREMNNDIRIPENCSQVSRNHAQLIVQGGQIFIEDLGTNNGTTVNGQRITGRVPVDLSSQIRFGSYVFDTSQLGPYLAGSQPAAKRTQVEPVGTTPSATPAAQPAQPPVAHAQQAVVVHAGAQGSQEGNGMAVAGFVLGLMSILFLWVLPLSLIFMILGLSLSSAGNGKANKLPHKPGKGLAVAGLVLSLITFSIYAIGLILFLTGVLALRGLF